MLRALPDLEGVRKVSSWRDMLAWLNAELFVTLQNRPPGEGRATSGGAYRMKRQK